MRLKTTLFLGSMALSVLLPGCSTDIGRFSAISTTDVEIKKSGYHLIARGVKGEDKKRIIFFVPTGRPRIELAVRDALAKANADILTNVSVQEKFFYIPYFYGEMTITVNGDAWRQQEGKEKGRFIVLQNGQKRELASNRGAFIY